jgi:hypothetical protein
MAREVLGNHHRKSPQRWMELRLYGDYRWQRPTNLGCGCRAQRRWTLYCAWIKSCLFFSNSNPQLKPTGIIMSAAESLPEPDEELGDNRRQSQQSWLELALCLSP